MLSPDWYKASTVMRVPEPLCSISCFLYCVTSMSWSTMVFQFHPIRREKGIKEHIYSLFKLSKSGMIELMILETEQFQVLKARMLLWERGSGGAMRKVLLERRKSRIRATILDKTFPWTMISR